MSIFFRGFGDDVYTGPMAAPVDATPAPDQPPYVGPGSPGYNYATPGQQYSADMSAAFTDPAYGPSNTWISPGNGTVNTSNPSDNGAISADSGSSSGTGSGWLSSIADIFKATAVGAGSVATLVNVHGQPQYPPGYIPPPVSTTPAWLMPAVLVGGGLLVLVMIKKSRKSSMAGYRRSRRSRR